MPVACSAYNCTNRFGKSNADGSKLRFHKFPHKRPHLLTKWVIATRRQSWQPSKSSVLCGDHFTDDCYASSSRRYLKETAVPSIFSFSQPKTKRGKVVKIDPYPEEPKKLQTTSEKFIVPLISYQPQEQVVVEVIPHSVLKSVPVEDKPAAASSSGEQNKIRQDKRTAVSTSFKHNKIEQDKPTAVSTSFKQNKPTSASAKCEQIEIDQNMPAADSTTCEQNEVEQFQTKAMLRRKVKILQQRLKRRDRKIAYLESMLLTIQETHGMSQNKVCMLKDTTQQPLIIKIESKNASDTDLQ